MMMEAPLKCKLEKFLVKITFLGHILGLGGFERKKFCDFLERDGLTTLRIF